MIAIVLEGIARNKNEVIAKSLGNNIRMGNKRGISGVVYKK